MSRYKLYIALESDILDREYEDELISIEMSENSMDSDLSAEPGICEQYINLSLYDRDGWLRQLAVNNDLESYDTTILVYKRDLSNPDPIESVELIGQFIVSQWDINIMDSLIKISGRDPSYLFDKITVVTANVADRTATSLFNNLFSQLTDYTFEMTQQAKLYCDWITVPNSWYSSSTLYEMLRKICILTYTRIYWDTDKFIIMEVLI